MHILLAIFEDKLLCSFFMTYSLQLLKVMPCRASCIDNGDSHTIDQVRRRFPHKLNVSDLAPSCAPQIVMDLPLPVSNGCIYRMKEIVYCISITNLAIWISSIFTVSQDVKECISLAVDFVCLKEMPSYEVEMHDHTDWIKQTQVSYNCCKCFLFATVVQTFKLSLLLFESYKFIDRHISFDAKYYPSSLNS
ncbi:Uncharacterized protein Fot_37540 [Forsythia ovata]|uniref:Uncharacterized protein n=1 Tax=Forsythia ovata TaxID=205694 RepID=A0ABD1RZV9_9LAMI